MQNELVSIALVDDQVAVRKGIALLLQQSGFFNVIIEVTNAQELHERLKSAAEILDILLLDSPLKDMCGLTTMGWCTENYPAIAVIIFTRCDTDLVEKKYYGLGAKAVLQKSI